MIERREVPTRVGGSRGIVVAPLLTAASEGDVGSWDD